MPAPTREAPIALQEVDQAEADLFRAWMAEQRAAEEAAAAAQRAAAEEEEAAVGPQLPPEAAAAYAADYGAFLRPGEGDRCAAGRLLLSRVGCVAADAAPVLAC